MEKEESTENNPQEDQAEIENPQSEKAEDIKDVEEKTEDKLTLKRSWLTLKISLQELLLRWKTKGEGMKKKKRTLLNTVVFLLQEKH